MSTVGEALTTNANDVIEISGTAYELRRQIIRHVVTAIEDDALWVHRIVAETEVKDGQIVARLISDLDSI